MNELIVEKDKLTVKCICGCVHHIKKIGGGELELNTIGKPKKELKNERSEEIEGQTEKDEPSNDDYLW